MMGMHKDKHPFQQDLRYDEYRCGASYHGAVCGFPKNDPIHDVDDHDPVNHPSHYTAHPSGVECIQITEHMNFCIGNVVKYVWRADEKGSTIEDLEKAAWYLNREIERRRRMQGAGV